MKVSTHGALYRAANEVLTYGQFILLPRPQKNPPGTTESGITGEPDDPLVFVCVFVCLCTNRVRKARPV